MSEIQERSAEDRIADLTAVIQDLSGRLEHVEAELKTLQDFHDEPTEEVMIAISAAVAAYLGKRATVKRVRLATGASSTGSAWAVQGRAAIQQSHTLHPSL